MHNSEKKWIVLRNCYKKQNSIAGSLFHSIIPLSSVPKRSMTALTSKETFLILYLICLINQLNSTKPVERVSRLLNVFFFIVSNLLLALWWNGYDVRQMIS